ncbi:MAG: hypothetical protein WCB68_06435 [Pyrinomonadaceae bacterium]
MRRFFVFSVTLVFFALALIFSSPYTSRTVQAVSKIDPCEKCLAKVEKKFEKCEAKHGGPSQECYDLFNQGIIDCYATVCEQ